MIQYRESFFKVRCGRCGSVIEVCCDRIGNGRLDPARNDLEWSHKVSQIRNGWNGSARWSFVDFGRYGLVMLGEMWPDATRNGR